MIILDLDNCISNDQWRLRFICDLEKNMDDKYEAYHTMCTLDNPENIHVIRDTDLIYIFTARPEKYKEKTLWWLAHHDIPVFEKHLFMRKNGDHRPATHVKSEMISLLHPKSVNIAYDDRQNIVDMYKSFGYNSARLFINNR